MSLLVVHDLLIVNRFQPPLEENYEDAHSRKSPPESDKKEAKSDAVISMPIPEVHSVGGVIVHMPHVCSVRGVLKLKPTKNWLGFRHIFFEIVQ